MKLNLRFTCVVTASRVSKPRLTGGVIRLPNFGIAVLPNPRLTGDAIGLSSLDVHKRYMLDLCELPILFVVRSTFCACKTDAWRLLFAL